MSRLIDQAIVGGVLIGGLSALMAVGQSAASLAQPDKATSIN
jgi:hypothetical protein